MLQIIVALSVINAGGINNITHTTHSQSVSRAAAVALRTQICACIIKRTRLCAQLRTRRSRARCLRCGGVVANLAHGKHQLTLSLPVMC
jgi:hypothetical protein